MRNTPLAVMLFAAGFGTRMGALTAHVPKPLIAVKNRPLIDYALDLTSDFGARPVVANLHYLPDMLESHLAPKGVLLSRETPDILETGGGLRAALPLLGKGPVFTLNTDAVWSGPNPLFLLAQRWEPAKMDGLLMCIPPASAIGHNGDGDFAMSETGALARGAGLIYGGAQIIKTDLLHEISETKFSLNLLWDKMLKNRRLFGMSYPGKWCDVGHPQGIEQAEALLDSQDV